jgi:hypothetical protein
VKFTTLGFKTAFAAAMRTGVHLDAEQSATVAANVCFRCARDAGSGVGRANLPEDCAPHRRLQGEDSQ